MERKINIIGLTIFFTLTLFSFVFSQESLTITTYYPSPYGSYNELTTTGNTYLATTSGKVGIGTTGPQAALDFGSTLGRKVNYYHDGANAGSGVRTASGLIIDHYIPSASEAITWSTYTGTWASPSYTERMRLTTAGNVGIGTASPGSALSFGSSLGRKVQYYDDGSYPTGVRTASGLIVDSYISASSQAITWSTYTGTINSPTYTERMRIAITGNVGIGTANPTQKLDVAGYVKGQSGLCIGNDCRSSWSASLSYTNEYTADLIYRGTVDTNMGSHLICFLTGFYTSDGSASCDHNCQIFLSGSNWILRASADWDCPNPSHTYCKARCLD